MMHHISYNISLTRSQKESYACKNHFIQTFCMLLGMMRRVQISSLEPVVQLLSELEYLQVCGGTRTQH